MKNTTFTTKRTDAKMVSIAILALFAENAQALCTTKDSTGKRTITGTVDDITIRFVYRPNRFGSLTATEKAKGKNSVYQNVDSKTIWHFLQKLSKKRAKAAKEKACRLLSLNSVENCEKRKKAAKSDSSDIWQNVKREFPALPCTVHSFTDKKGKQHNYFAIDCDVLYMQSYTDICNALLTAMQACKTKFCTISKNSAVSAPKKWLGHMNNLSQAYCRLCAQYNTFAIDKNAEIRIFDKQAKKSVIYRQADYITFVLSSLVDESYDYYSIVIKTIQFMQTVDYTVTTGTAAKTIKAYLPKSYGARLYNSYKRLNKALEKQRKEYNENSGSLNDSDFTADLAVYASYIDSEIKSSTADIVNKICAGYDSTARLLLSTYGKMKTIGKNRSKKGFGIVKCAIICGITNPNKAHKILKKFENDLISKYPDLRLNKSEIDENEQKAIELEKVIAAYAQRKKAVTNVKTSAQAVLKMLW